MHELASGGGYLNGLVVHDIDFICSLFGEPVAVCACVRSSIPTRDLREGGTPEVADGLRAQRVIEAARASSAGAGWVTL